VVGFGEHVGDWGLDRSSRPRLEPGRGDDLREAEREVIPEESRDSLGGDGRR